MRAQEKTYALALMALVLIGVSAAWAGYTATSTVTVGTVSELADVVSNSPDLKLEIYKWGWFYKSEDHVFNITDPSDPSKSPKTNDIFVRIVLVNAPELRQYFKYLIIKVNMTDGTESVVEYMSLVNAEVFLNATSLLTESNPWTVNITVYGFAWKKSESDITFDLYCSVEPAAVST